MIIQNECPVCKPKELILIEDTAIRNYISVTHDEQALLSKASSYI